MPRKPNILRPVADNGRIGKVALTISLIGFFAVAGISSLTAAPEENVIESESLAKPAKSNCILAVEGAIENLLNEGYPATGTKGRAQLTDGEKEAALAFYTARNNSPLWIEGFSLSDEAKQVAEELRSVSRYGLDPKDFPVDDVDAEKTGWISKTCTNGEELARADLKLTASAMVYARFVRGGRLDLSKVSYDLDRRGDILAPTEVLEALASKAHPVQYLRSLHPTHEQYGLLMKALVKERAKAKSAKQDALTSGPTLKVGVVHPQVPLLRKRLGVKVSEKTRAKPGYNPERFDWSLRNAVRKFQRRHKLATDGIFGPKSRGTLTGFSKKRLNNILVNLERWRWMPRNLGSRYIRVNVPEYLLRVVDSGRTVHEERVVVGKPQTRTPLFSDRLEKVVFNPYWNVPQSIFLDEWGGRIPNGYDAKYRGGQWIVRQPPGPRNALGKIKFLFPNKHSVYVHDTPKKSLFKRKQRAFSHGCVRVRNPQRLAEVVFQTEKDWNKRKVDRAYRGHKNRAVALTRTLPVHVTYFTAWANKDGTLTEFSDIYGHDRRIAGALRYAPPAPPDRKIKPKKRRANTVIVRRKKSRSYRYVWRNGHRVRVRVRDEEDEFETAAERRARKKAQRLARKKARQKKKKKYYYSGGYGYYTNYPVYQWGY